MVRVQVGAEFHSDPMPVKIQSPQRASGNSWPPSIRWLNCLVRVDDVRPLLLEDIKGFRLGNLDRYLYRILRSVNATPPSMLDGKESPRPRRASEDVIRSELQGCLNEIDKYVDLKLPEWVAIQQAFAN